MTCLSFGDAYRWKSSDPDVVGANPDSKRISRIYHYETTPQMIDGVLHASTWVGVPALEYPQLKVEVEAIAIVEVP